MRRVIALGFLYYATYVACAASPSPSTAAITAETPSPPGVLPTGRPTRLRPQHDRPRPGAEADPDHSDTPADSARAFCPKKPARSPPEAPEGREQEFWLTLTTALAREGMRLVEGEYCTKVEHKCVKQWHDKARTTKTSAKSSSRTATCVGQKLKKHFCMDTYTWPNEKGARPEVMNKFHQAQVKCAAVGKRMCTESEWTLACEGPEMLAVPLRLHARHQQMPWRRGVGFAPDMKKVAQRDPEELARSLERRSQRQPARVRQRLRHSRLAGQHGRGDPERKLQRTRFQGQV